MSGIFKNKGVLRDCKIYQMLKKNAKGKRLVMHMPGHKAGKWDITELSYSDNLASPRGCIAEAESAIAEILGADKSFLLTDGSTCGVHAMLYAAKLLGVQKIALSENMHQSVFYGCRLLGITPLVYTEKEAQKISFPPTMYELKRDFSEILRAADALFVTSPNYYGRVADLAEMRKYCQETGKLFLVDGAHGGHLHFDKKRYAGSYADMWVDGVHKSLPALTQGAVVSAKSEKYSAALWEGVRSFRTTSPSYPIMASVEYAVKYPRNERLEQAAYALMDGKRIVQTDDWTKICVLFGKRAFEANAALEQAGVYAELCDGNTVLFYLSPATKKRDFEKLKKWIFSLLKKYPYEAEKGLERIHTPLVCIENKETEWTGLQGAAGKICAADCGIFPPCTPLIRSGERIEKAQIELLRKATNTYGLSEGKILTVKEEEV